MLSASANVTQLPRAALSCAHPHCVLYPPPHNSVQCSSSSSSSSTHPPSADAQREKARDFLLKARARRQRTVQPQQPPRTPPTGTYDAQNVQGPAQPGGNGGGQPEGVRRSKARPHAAKSAFEAQLASVPGLRKRFVPATNNPRLPALSSLVIVEGWADVRAVQCAANVAVYVCDGDTVKSAHAQRRLRALTQWDGELVVLTDPDAGGRMLRIFLDDTFRQQQQQQQQQQQRSGPAVLHAFVPIDAAVSTVANSRHDVGSIGVENASAVTIRESLQSAAPSYHPRQEFSQAELMEAGFINTFSAKQVHGAKLRRQVLCNALGMDSCTGSALITALNRFFTRQQYESAVQQAEIAMRDMEGETA